MMGAQENKMTLILGGNGKTGRRVAERLIREGLPVRIGSRSGEPAFDWEDQTTWLPALERVKSVYVTYYPDLGFPGAAETVRAFTKLAAEKGVRRLVLLSGRGEEGARLGEQAVRDSGAEWTIVRASWFSRISARTFSSTECFAARSHSRLGRWRNRSSTQKTSRTSRPLP